MKIKELHTKRPKRTDIQALRAIAVLAVVAYHLWPSSITGGFMGVDIFFVISGYLMTTTIMRDVNLVTTAKHRTKAALTFLTNFYARRIKRLIPAAAVTLLGTLGLVYATGNLNLISKTADQVLASTFFVQNWKLASESTDYLAPSEPPTAVQHFWSLSLEEQFYLIWPLLLILVSVTTSALFLLYKKHKIPGAILPVSLLTVSLFLYGLILTKTNPSEAYFVTPARMWELMIGGLIAFLPALKHSDAKLLAPWIGSAIILYALFELDGVNFPGWHALLPVIGTGLILYGGSSESESRLSFAELLKSRPIQWIGDVSYSLYLWHWPLIVLLPILLTVDIEGANGNYIKFGLLTLSFLLAWLSFKYVEQPPLRLQLRRRWIYISFIGTLTLVGGSAYIVSSTAKQSADEGLRSLHSLALNTQDLCFGARAIAHSEECGNPFGKINKEWAQYTKADFSLSLIHDRGRFCSYYRVEEKSSPDTYCEYGDLQATTHITIWGDSHADHWANALDDIGRRNNIKFIHLSSGSCAADSVKESLCAERINSIKNLELLQTSSAVLVSVVAKDSLNRMQNTISTISEITASPIYLLEDIPSAGTNGGPDCITKGHTCKEKRDTVTDNITTLSTRLVENSILKSDRIIPTSDLLCQDSTCYSFIGGVSVYRDTSKENGFINSHLSAVFSMSASLLLENQLRKAGVLPSLQNPE